MYSWQHFCSCTRFFNLSYRQVNAWGASVFFCDDKAKLRMFVIFVVYLLLHLISELISFFLRKVVIEAIQNGEEMLFIGCFFLVPSGVIHLWHPQRPILGGTVLTLSSIKEPCHIPKKCLWHAIFQIPKKLIN